MRIARAAGPLEDATVVEVGPGPGGLTRALLALGARHVIAVERDQRALPALEEIAHRYPGRLEVVCTDAQQFDPRPFLGSTRAKIVANLPYNIATQLLIGWLSLEPWPPWYDMMVLMFQREVAERIVARENDEAYGRLGVLANWRAETRILFDISPAAFVPQPQVTSSLFRLIPRSAPDVASKPQILIGRSRKARGCGPRRPDPPCRNHSDQRLCCHGAGIDQYSPKQLNIPQGERHAAHATPIAGPIRCAAV
jgi:16S rRNA (adenine1518-N6/adenine1519-N6)-dimethyltransferase